MSSGKIGHPRKNKKIHWRENTAKFIAFGRASADVKEVVGKLFNEKDNSLVATGTTQRQPTAARPLWVILFTGIDYTDADTKPSYKLEVRDQSGALLDSTTNLKVEKLRSPANQTLQTLQSKGNVEIIYPANNENVCPFFVAYGTTDVAGSLACNLMLVGNEVAATGEPVSSGDQNVWCASFLGVAEGTYDKLTAQIGTTSAVPSNTINAADSFCSGNA